MTAAQVERPVLRPSRRYPMLRAGGLFLTLIGLGLIGAIAFSGDALINYKVFFAGAAAGIVSLFFARRLSTGRPTKVQVLALAGAILLEGLLFVAMGRTLPLGTAEHVRWLWASVIVGVHFLPMSICFGPRFAVLGVACIANAALGLLASAVPYEFFGLVDGALKLDSESCPSWTAESLFENEFIRSGYLT